MKVYKFIFVIGLTNLIIPFVGITFVYKQYVSIVLAGITIIYALIIRAVVKEKENFKKQEFAQKTSPVHMSNEPKKIEDVVEMQEDEMLPVVTSVKKTMPKPRKSKILVKSNSHE